MDRYTFRGGPVEVGKAQGALDPDRVRQELEERMGRPHNYGHPYFRKNTEFMRREFPDFIAQMEAFGEAVGIDDFDDLYYLHIYHTGRVEDACSAFGILLEDDGPALLSVGDACGPVEEADVARENIVSVFPDLEPHGFLGVCKRYLATAVGSSVNDSGLLLGCASGHPKFNWPDDPEHLNLYVFPRLLIQHCADCDDVRHFLSQYRISGVKGTNGVAVDAAGNILGFELESSNIAFREPEDGMLLEVNHFQHPDLQVPSRGPRAEFWRSPYYYNSQNRVQYVSYFREDLKGLKTLDELRDFAFDVCAPGRFLQMVDHNISNWCTYFATFMRARDRIMRVHPYPLDKGTYDELAYEACV